MLTTTFASGFGSNYVVTAPETIYPAFSQVIVFDTASTGTRLKLPNYVNTIRILAWGGGGASGARGPGGGIANDTFNSPGARKGGNGGNGGFVQADVPIIPGTILKVRVAGGGPAANLIYGGSGGGYSSVELPTSFPNYHLVVAAGGGGGGNAPPYSTLTPSPTAPLGYYYPGGAGGPAFADGLAAPGAFFPGSNGQSATISTGGFAGSMPIGAVPVPLLGPYLGPIYGPYTPGQAPFRKSANGTFLTGGGSFSGQTGGINGGGLGFFNIVPTASAWNLGPQPPALPPGHPFHPTAPQRVIQSGGGGGGYYGGGMAHPTGLWTGSLSYGQYGGGGGSSYINPTASNTAMANTGPYAPNPYYSAYANPTRLNAIGGDGVGAPGPEFAPGPTVNFTSNQGGDGLVVIIY